jgi:putative Holliday junction resolvase
MRILGIDYGSKRIGLAVSDDKAIMAFPHSVIPNDEKLYTHIGEIVRKSGIELIVVGESKNYKGKDNRIMDEIRVFVTELARLGYKITYEPELLSSHQASHFQGKTAMTDASAASIILQSYIDRKKHEEADKVI